MVGGVQVVSADAPDQETLDERKSARLTPWQAVLDNPLDTPSALVRNRI